MIFARGQPLRMIICKRPASPDQQQPRWWWGGGHQGDRGNQGWRDRRRRRRKWRRRRKRRRRRRRNSCTGTGGHTGQPKVVQEVLADLKNPPSLRYCYSIGEFYVVPAQRPLHRGWMQGRKVCNILTINFRIWLQSEKLCNILTINSRILHNFRLSPPTPRQWWSDDL